MKKINLSEIFANTYMGLLFEAQKTDESGAQTQEIWQKYQAEIESMTPSSRLELNLFLDAKVDESNKKRLLKALSMPEGSETGQEEKELDELTFLFDNYQKMNKQIEDYQNQMYEKGFGR